MEKRLKSFLNLLKEKYAADPDLHIEIAEKIQARIAPMFDISEDFYAIEKTVLHYVEETYRRMLTTKGHIKEANIYLSEFLSQTQKNIEMLSQIADPQTSIEQQPELVEMKGHENRLVSPSSSYSLIQSSLLLFGFGKN